MSRVVVRPLEGQLGARVVGVDADRFRDDESLPGQCMEALEKHSVLVFPELFIDDAAQMKFSGRLGELESGHRGTLEVPQIMTVSLDPAKHVGAEYFRGSFLWHTDGVLTGIPDKVTVLSMRQLSDHGGDTEFVSTYAAYDDLSDDEKERFASLRVVHSLEAQQRLLDPDPTPEQVESWRRFPPREHPLVWQHKSGRRSLLCGSSVSHVVGMDPDKGRALLAELEARATAPDKVYRHMWALGDVLIWYNAGCMHRVHPYDPSSGRELHRTTIPGTEAIQ